MARTQRSGRSGANGPSRRAATSTSDPAAPFSSSAYSNKTSNKPRRPRPSADGPRGLHDVYDFAQASTSAAAKQGRGARRATAGMHSEDYADLPSQAKGKQPRRRRADDDDEEEDDDESDDDDKPVGPKVFDSDDELNDGIEGTDEELDSDEAFGESDDEKFDGWTFGRRTNNKSSRNDDNDDAEEGEGEDDDEDGGMMDLSRMLDSASGESDGSDDEEDSDNDNDNDDDETSSKLAKHIQSFAAGSKRQAGSDSGSDDQADSDAEPSAKRSRRVVLSERTEAIPETEFAATHSGSTLRLEDFMSPLSANVDFADVRKSTKLLANAKDPSSAPVASKKGGGALAAPLPSVVQDRLDRQGAYSITRDEVQGWQPTINRLRDAEHLSFPLQKPAKTKASTSGLVATFTPDTDMEASIAAMLDSGGLTEKQLAQQEDLAMNKLDPNEARARRDELRRMRMLLFRAEQKAKRVAKIKSKAYRKIHRKDKERLKAQMAELESEDEIDEEGGMDERMKAERDRARERATLKHKNTSKWAKNILHARHGEHNQEARNELEAQLNRGTELRAKIEAREMGDSDDSDDYSDGGEVDEAEVARDAFDELKALEVKEDARRKRDEEELERVGGKKGVYGMKFMKDARERQYAGIRGDVDDFVSEMHQLGAEQPGSDDEVAAPAKAESRATYVQGNKGRAMYGAASANPTPRAVETPSAPAAPAAVEDVPSIVTAAAGVEVGGSATSRKKPKSATAAAAAADEEEENPWLMIDSRGQASKLSRKKNDSSLAAQSASSLAATKSALRASKAASRSESSLAAKRSDDAIDINTSTLLHNSDSDEEQPMPIPRSRSKVVLQQRDLVASAFATDDVVSEFAAEKEAAMEADESKEVDTRLPGWGSWTGRGTRAPSANPRFVKKVQGVDRDKRKDAKMAHVIIAEKRDKKQDKFTRKDLPYPYTSVAQYKAAMNQPLGKEWNTLTEKQRLTLPRVTAKPGKVITPVARKF
ncbi:related to UTP14 - subunit of U3-containing small subunit processome complex [Moesziomyces antarcticus]|uniref:Related to UTP14 - subunit of U3-containing small subunit processome complex n=1 Tax=Pseudozyma antarctica TaxID=84753 RepID=A0A5C3FW36_PSEA2|nr:related to UTP14 - subunit of U3-containing small subunit processome complex [Moesziomyces antarcticus]